MNNSSQFILVSVPLEMFLEAGINTESIIQVSAREGKIIIDTPDTTEDYVCDRDCDNCPLNAAPCEFNCEDCLCEANCDGRGMDE